MKIQSSTSKNLNDKVEQMKWHLMFSNLLLKMKKRAPIHKAQKKMNFLEAKSLTPLNLKENSFQKNLSMKSTKTSPTKI